MDDVGVGSILDYAVEEDLEKSDAIEMEMDSCSSGPGFKLMLQRLGIKVQYIFWKIGLANSRQYCSINLRTPKRYS